ncbi:hypothetical protein M1M85_00715, partial [Nitrospinaceae bacterium]|nr:hypothetical protein [Nitrospinaceae bacterium]
SDFRFPIGRQKIQAQIKRFCKNLVMKEDGLLWDSEVSGAVAKFQVILMILSTYISARIHGECCTATSVLSCS